MKNSNIKRDQLEKELNPFHNTSDQRQTRECKKAPVEQGRLEAWSVWIPSFEKSPGNTGLPDTFQATKNSKTRIGMEKHVIGGDPNGMEV